MELAPTAHCNFEAKEDAHKTVQFLSDETQIEVQGKVRVPLDENNCVAQDALKEVLENGVNVSADESNCVEQDVTKSGEGVSLDGNTCAAYPFWPSTDSEGMMWWHQWTGWDMQFYATGCSISGYETSKSEETTDEQDTSAVSSPISPDMTPLSPPGVFVTSPPHAICTLADIGYGWECWQGQNTPDWETASETGSIAGFSTSGSISSSSSRSRRRNAPIYVGQHLAWLETKDANCVCILRKIHKLRFDAADILCEHFRQWGPVEKILLSNQPAEGPDAETMPGTRHRPSGMGWIVMQNAEDAAKVNRQKYHQVGQVLITAERFVSRRISHNKLDEVTEEEEPFDDLLAKIVDSEARMRWSDMME